MKQTDDNIVIQERIVCVAGFVLGTVSLLWSLHEPPTSTRVGARIIVASGLCVAWLIGRFMHPVLKDDKKMGFAIAALAVWYSIVGYIQISIVD